VAASAEKPSRAPAIGGIDERDGSGDVVGGAGRPTATPTSSAPRTEHRCEARLTSSTAPSGATTAMPTGALLEDAAKALLARAQRLLGDAAAR
jgi:hypothetical protein